MTIRQQIINALKKLNLPAYDLVDEQTKDKELLQFKEELQNGRASQAINSQYILLVHVLYYLWKAESDPLI